MRCSVVKWRWPYVIRSPPERPEGYIRVDELMHYLRREEGMQCTSTDILRVAGCSWSERRQELRFATTMRPGVVLLKATRSVCQHESPGARVTSDWLEQEHAIPQEADSAASDEVNGRYECNASDGACCVCLTNAVTYATTPCGHYCLCAECASSWRNGGICPWCQREVDGVLQIFRSAPERWLTHATPGGA